MNYLCLFFKKKSYDVLFGISFYRPLACKWFTRKEVWIHVTGKIPSSWSSCLIEPTKI